MTNKSENIQPASSYNVLGRSRVLVVHHSPSPNLHELLDAVLRGLNYEGLEDIEAVIRPALGATASDMLNAQALIALTPANFGYMSGALKLFFDTAYYPCLGAVDGRPFGAVVHGNNDLAGAVKSVELIAGSWGLTKAAATVQCAGSIRAVDRESAAELAATVAASLVI